VHDSHLIAYYHINKVLNEDGGIVITSSNERIPISRRRKSDFQDWLKEAS
jgi:two-component system, LytTR family, response regulator